MSLHEYWIYKTYRKLNAVRQLLLNPTLRKLWRLLLLTSYSEKAFPILSWWSSGFNTFFITEFKQVIKFGGLTSLAAYLSRSWTYSRDNQASNISRGKPAVTYFSLFRFIVLGLSTLYNKWAISSEPFIYRKKLPSGFSQLPM